MAELFAVGAFWFWALIAVELILLLVFTEFENGWAASLSLVGFWAVLQFVSHVDVFGYIVAHPIHLLTFVLAYLALGVVWGIFKWRKFVFKRLDEHDELYADFLKSKKLPANTTELPVELRREWKWEVDKTRDHKGNTVADTPQARHNKARITRWMTLWVFSVALYLFKDMVAEVFTGIYKRLAFFLQRIADNIYGKRDLKKNLDLTDAPPDENNGRGYRR